MSAVACVDAASEPSDETTIALDCEDATQLEPTDFGEFGVQMFPGASPAGIERCDFATFNATDVVACATATTLEDCEVPVAEGGGCGIDAPCARGRCINAAGDCRCVDFCASDDDCGGGDACVCSSGLRIDETSHSSMTPVPTCVPAECRTGADCLSGACGVAINSCGTPLALRCRSVADACVSNADCAEQGDGVCVADNGSGWICGGGTCE